MLSHIVIVKMSNIQNSKKGEMSVLFFKSMIKIFFQVY